VAELDERAAKTAGDIPATTQLIAIAWLRWRMFANSFRRRSTGPRQVAGLILTVVLRLLLWPIFAMMAIGPAVGAGFFAWMAISDHHPQRLAMLLAAVAVFWQFVAVNGVSMAAQISSFDPASLLRFPLRFGRYLVLRLALGLLTPSTIIGCLALLSAAVGIGIADVSLFPAALAVLSIYAAMNIFFSRMIGVWLERALATRRAREIFGVIMALFFVSFQFVNYGRMGSHRHADPATNSWLLNFMHGTNHFLLWLPPGFACNAIVLGGHPLARLAQFAALLAWTAAFFASFAARLHKQFLGEYLSEGAPRAAAAATPRTHPQPQSPAAPEAQPATYNLQPATAFLSPAIAACLRKEWLYIRGNGAMLVSLLMPLIFVFILSRGLLQRHPSYLLPGAIGYALMGLMVALYNIFGADSTGVQLYLLAPVCLRDVIVAKNIASLALLLLEAALAWGLVAVLATAPIPLSAQVSTVFWVVFMVFSNLALGTLRSIQAPRKISVAQARRVRQTAVNKTTGLLVLAVLFGCILLQIPVTLLCRYFHNPWLAAAIFAPLAAAAIGVYALLLNDADRLILAHRDQFAEELCGD
jgi:ABC-2 type transport system permease protein